MGEKIPYGRKDSKRGKRVFQSSVNCLPSTKILQHSSSHFLESSERQKGKMRPVELDREHRPYIFDTLILQAAVRIAAKSGSAKERSSPRKPGIGKGPTLRTLPALLPFIPDMLKQELFQLQEADCDTDSMANLVILAVTRNKFDLKFYLGMMRSHYSFATLIPFTRPHATATSHSREVLQPPWLW